MSVASRNRTKAKIVAIVNMVLSVGSFFGLGVWLYFDLKDIANLADYFSTADGKEVIGVCILILVAIGLETSLACLLLFAVRENSFTKLKIWFLVQTVYLACVTLGFLVILTSPQGIYLIPIFLVIIYKSITLWIISRLVDEMKLESQQGRLISPFSPQLPDGRQGYDSPYTYSPTASHSHN